MSENRNKGVIRLQLEDLDKDFEEISKDKSIGNNDWSLYVGNDVIDEEKYLKIRLICNEMVFSNLWSCSASIKFSLIKFSSEDSENSFSMDFVKKFTREDDRIELKNFKKWAELMDLKNNFVVGNTAVVEVSIIVNNSTGWNKFVEKNFEKPNDPLTDVILVVEGKKLHVGKQILSIHSNYFKALFYSDFKKSKETEIIIEDVKYDEMVDLLNCIYPTHFYICESNFAHILKLADRFQVWKVIEDVERFLIDSPKIHVVDKLRYAETYKFGTLQDDNVDNFESAEEILELTKHENYKKLGDVTLSLLFQKIADLEKEKEKQ